jgi:hypothetical protein
MKMAGTVVTVGPRHHMYCERAREIVGLASQLLRSFNRIPEISRGGFGTIDSARAK